jgi:hypothetical protein
MKTRRFFTRALPALLILVAVVFALLPRSEGVTKAQFELLKPGMTQTEVERLLHGPPRNGIKFDAVVWEPHADGKRRSAFVGPGTPGVEFLVSRDRPPNEVAPKKAQELSYFPGTTPERGNQAVWITETGLIAVYFGPGGRLEQKYFSEVDVSRPPTVLDWLGSRPRMIRQSLSSSLGRLF